MATVYHSVSSGQVMVINYTVMVTFICESHEIHASKSHQNSPLLTFLYKQYLCKFFFDLSIDDGKAETKNEKWSLAPVERKLL